MKTMHLQKQLQMMKFFSFIRHFGLALLFAIIVFFSSWLSFEIFPSLGYGILWVIYALIIASLIYYYNLTSYYGFSKSLLHFVFNFVFWCIEQIIISTNFEKTFLYQNENYKILIVILGATLWATNKLLLDSIFRIWKSADLKKNKIELWLPYGIKN